MALHAYYFGLGMGLIVAGLASVLYVMSDYPEFQTIVWHEYTLRITFLFLVATFLGLLAEKDKGDKQHMESLNRELSEKTRKLELAYIQLAEAHGNHSDRKAFLARNAGGRRRHEIIILSELSPPCRGTALEHEDRFGRYAQADLEVIPPAHRVAEITTALLAYARSHPTSRPCST